LQTNVPVAEPAFVKAAAEPKKQEEQSTADSLKEKLKSVLPSASDAKAAFTGDVEIGIMGILHPTVLINYELDYPCSVFEFTLEGL
jgi:phenylalanyl-tRNA synthetase beta chain